MSLYVFGYLFEPYIEIWQILKIFLNILLILVICFQKIVEFGTESFTTVWNFTQRKKAAAAAS
jgi:hypothetical protein